MRKSLAVLALVLLLAPQPAEAFSLKTPIKKVGHALKVGAKKVGEVALYGFAVFIVLEICMHNECTFQ